MAITKFVLKGKKLEIPVLEDVLADSNNGIKNKAVNTYLKNNSALTTTSKEVVGAINELKLGSVGRFTEMPAPSVTYANGAIYQYIGATTAIAPIYTHGKFYECKESQTVAGVYEWVTSGGDGNYVTVDTEQEVTGQKVFAKNTVFKNNPIQFTTIYADGSVQLTADESGNSRVLTVWPDRISRKVNSTVYNFTYPAKDGQLALQHEITNQIVTAKGVPTTTTSGKLGQLYINSQTGNVYHLDSITGGTYNWSEFKSPIFTDVEDFPLVGEENTIYRSYQAIESGEDPQLVCKFYSDNVWHPLAAAKIAGDEETTSIYTDRIFLNKSSQITNKDADTSDCATTLLSRTDNAGRYVFYGGTDWGVSAFMEFYGTDIDSSFYPAEYNHRKGMFMLGTGKNGVVNYELLGENSGELTWRKNNDGVYTKNTVLTTGNIQKILLEMMYPIGAHYVQLAGMPAPATAFGGTWSVDTSYDGKALWVDSTKSAGTAITQSLPKPTLTFTGSSATTSSNGAHTHSRGTMEISGTFGSVCCQGGNGTGAFSWKRDSAAELSGDNQSRGTFTFTASNNWSGETSSSGAHTHTVTAKGTVTCNTAGVYGTGTTVQPPAITCIVWKRTA